MKAIKYLTILIVLTSCVKTENPWFIYTGWPNMNVFDVKTSKLIDSNLYQSKSYSDYTEYTISIVEWSSGFDDDSFWYKVHNESFETTKMDINKRPDSLFSCLLNRELHSLKLEELDNITLIYLRELISEFYTHIYNGRGFWLSQISITCSIDHLTTESENLYRYREHNTKNYHNIIEERADTLRKFTNWLSTQRTTYDGRYNEWFFTYTNPKNLLDFVVLKIKYTISDGVICVKSNEIIGPLPRRFVRM